MNPSDSMQNWLILGQPPAKVFLQLTNQMQKNTMFSSMLIWILCSLTEQLLAVLSLLKATELMVRDIPTARAAYWLSSMH